MPFSSSLDNVDGSRVGEIDHKTGKIIKIDLDRQLLKPLAGKGKMFVMILQNM